MGQFIYRMCNIRNKHTENDEEKKKIKRLYVSPHITPVNTPPSYSEWCNDAEIFRERYNWGITYED